MCVYVRTHECVYEQNVTAEEYKLSENEEGCSRSLLLLFATIILQERDLCGVGYDTHTHTHGSLGIASAAPPPPNTELVLVLLPRSTPKLYLAALVPQGAVLGPLAADCRFPARIKPLNDSHSVMIYTALLYTPTAPSSC